MIDPRAVVHEDAKLHPSVKVAPYAIIGPNVEIGAGTTIGASAIVDGCTTTGKDCRIFPHAAVGLEPQDLKYAGENTTLDVGDRTVIREFATLNTGTEGGGGRSAVGSDCLLMTYSHVAHDCIVGNNVVMANSATLAGHESTREEDSVFGLGGTEIAVLFLIILLIFGPSQIPKMAKGVGQALREFRKAQNELKNEINKEDETEPVTKKDEKASDKAS